jgi:hypothetical protein
MRAPTLPILVILGLAISLASSSAAQAPPTSPTAPSGLRVEAQASEQVSDKEKLSQANGDLEQMRGVLKDVLKRLEEARNEKDVVKLNCVNEKLTQIKGLLKIAEQSDVALQESIAQGDEGSAQHEFAKVSIAKQKVDQLRAEAEQCIGQLAYVVDEKTQVTVETPEGLPDAITNPPTTLPLVVNPPAVSPTD